MSTNWSPTRYSADSTSCCATCPVSCCCSSAVGFDRPLALPRLRLDGRLHDVRASDLAFTADETRGLLRAQQISLPDNSVALLLERTEGWPAALRLAALSLSEEADPAAFVTAFAGDQHGVADYLMAEVLSRQSDDVREFLVGHPSRRSSPSISRSRCPDGRMPERS